MNYKFITALTVLFVAVLLISNVVSTKIVDLRWFVFDAGTLLFPLSYIIGDVLTEVYGYKQARRVIWMGFFSALLMAITFIVVGMLPPASDWANQSAYDAILGLTPRIVLASLVAYIVGEFLNSYILAKMKLWTAGAHLYARTIGSTIVGQFADTLLFVAIAFTGILPASLLVTIIVSNYVFKVGIEVLFTPITYKVVAFLKREEGVDHFDRGTNFNPLSRA